MADGNVAGMFPLEPDPISGIWHLRVDMNKEAFATAVASVAVAGTIAAPAMADETAVTPVEQAQQAVAQAQEAVDQAATQQNAQ